MRQKRGVYLFLLSAFALGCLWLFVSQTSMLEGFSVCIFKHIWGIPCPSCGSTHGVVALLHGNFTEALVLNPNSFIIAAGMLFVPLCALYDVLRRDDLLYRSFSFFCQTTGKTAVFVPFLVFEALVWCYKLQWGA